MFKDFSKAVHAQYTEMAKCELYVVDAPNLFEAYLAAWPEGTNPMFRKRTEHDCACCKQFVRTLGKVVGIKNGKIVTVWDDLDVPHPYNKVSEAMMAAVRAAPILTVFRTKERKYGTDHNYDKVTNERWEHFHGEVADRHYHKDFATKRGEQEAIHQVLKRGLTEFRTADVEAVLDLIDSNGLYKGAEFRPAIVGFQDLMKRFREIDTDLGRGIFVWSNLENKHAKFRNTVIGNLFVELANGVELETAVKKYEAQVAPANYKRPTSVITQKMVEQAVQTLTDLGLGGAIYRQFAKLSDVSVNDVLFVDNDVRGQMKDGIAALLETSVKKATVDPKKAFKMSADEFLRDVLGNSRTISGARTLDLFLENRHTANFVSLTRGDGGSRLFKWDNDFAWSYDGDVTDSVKQRVKAAGGNINAKLRVSLSWFNFDDLDLHAHTPGGTHVYYGNKFGILDVDMNAGLGKTRNAVENLAFNDLRRDGTYKIYVNQYNRRESIDVGFAIEVEFDGVVSQYSYSRAVSGDVQCFNLEVKGGKLIAINPSPELVGGNSSQEKWGVKTEGLVPVTAVMYSPNHWGGQAVGAKHLIFSLKDCQNPEPTRGIYNEFLRGDLEKHRKVFEVLGAKTKAKPTPDQVSGVGFTNGRNDSVTVVVDGRRSYTLSF